MITDLPRCDLAGPVGDHRYPQTALVEGALLAAKLDRCTRVHVGSVEATGCFFAAEVILAAVVATEDDEGLLIEFEFLQQFDDLSDLTIDHADHGGVTARLTRPRLIFELLPGGILFGDIEQSMRRGDR